MVLIVFGIVTGYSQESLSELLKKHNTNAVPYISVQELAMPKTQAVILDARERPEFEVSHINNAMYVGYNNFDLEQVQTKIPDKNQTIVVYCSLGIRSEDIAEKLQKAGYKQVYNLYGGIFEWKNADYTVFDDNGETTKVHGFSKEWSKWLKKGDCVYE
ncbi:rhodanese-like domain-containing protein [Hanstruepera neustonica]|nr:rhodanese-like domain-containing protein [Hanstruepera neustonica]